MPKILIVDDDVTITNLMQVLVSMEGHQPTTVNDSLKAIETANSVNPDLITLDLMMPEMDGWEVYQQIKADEKMKKTPVIVVTAKAQSIDRVLGLHIAKVDDYIAKPFSPQE